MRAAFIKAPFQVEVREIDDPAPGHGEVLLAVSVVGICGTDVHLARGWAGDWTRFGHETAAFVAKLGAGVHDLKEGDLVAVQATTACGVYRFCMDGRVMDCLDWTKSRLPVALADYMLAPRTALWKVDGIGPEAAALIEPLTVALDVVEVADVRLDSDVAIVGPGPIGIMAIKLAKLRGARRLYVAGTGDDAHRFPLCRELGADLCIDVDGEDPVEVIRHDTGGIGVDRVIVTAPPSAVHRALAMARSGGIISFVGFSEAGTEAVVPIDLNRFHFDRLQLRASYAAPASRFPLANRLLREGHFPVDKFITHRFPLDHVGEALQIASTQTG